MRILVLHSLYGCETGCCGHIVEVDGVQAGRFHLDHPESDDDKTAFIRKLVVAEVGEAHAEDIDFANSIALPSGHW